VRVSDGTNSSSQAIPVTLTNVNEFTPSITTPTFSTPENTTAIGTVGATDGDSGAVITYSLTGGLDKSLFAINSSSGVLTFLAAHDFENPNDNGANNVYDVVVGVSDGSLSSSQAVAVTVTNVNDRLPSPTSTITPPPLPPRLSALPKTPRL
jgi:serralysin